MALLPSVKVVGSDFLVHGPKYWALAFASGIVAISNGIIAQDFPMAQRVLEGSTINATSVMDYFGITSLESCENQMVQLRVQAADFLNRSEMA
jgi:hypothetical protein